MFVNSLLRKKNEAAEKRQRGIKKQKSEELKRKERLMRYRGCRRKKLFLFMLAMSTLTFSPSEF